MRCKLVRDDMEVAPGVMPSAFVSANAYARNIKRNGRVRQVLFWKSGTVFDLPDSYRLVQQGCAIPDDEECLEKADRTPEEMATAQRAYERVCRGIAPEDYDLFDNGVIVGYEEDGSYKPGANFHLLEEAAAEAGANEVVTPQGPE